jgi:serine protease AprX
MRLAFRLSGPVALLVTIALAWPVAASAQHRARMAKDVTERIGKGGPHRLQVIVDGPQSVIDRLVEQYGVTLVKRLRSGAVLSGAALQLHAMASDDQVPTIAAERMVAAMQTPDVSTTGADLVRRFIGDRYFSGITGQGIGIAVIDSGVSQAHRGVRRQVIHVRDFVTPGGAGDDEYGHGTHVAGILVGTGEDSREDDDQAPFSGVAPGAQIISLRVLDGQGIGLVSNVVAAIDWCVANKLKFNIRIINLSLGHPPAESLRDDPLVKAVDRAVAAGIVVVTSAGNLGKLADGTPVVGGIVTPGIAPGAITVGP